MRILVLGASSMIGSCLAAEFAPGNTLLLAGRNGKKLAVAAERCRAAGAVEAACVEQDLAQGTGEIRLRLADAPVDLLIDAASASSRQRDGELRAAQLAPFAMADFTSKVELVDWLLTRQPRAPGIVFISTVLVKLMSPERLAYSSLKRLHGLYLEKAAAEHPDMNLLVVHVGSVLATDRTTPKHGRLAAAARRAYEQGRREISLGTSGRLFAALFQISPLAFLAVARLRRRLSRSG